MPPVEKLWSTYKATADFDTFTADEHEIFYEPSTGDLRLDDGSTPGGIPLTFTEIRFDTTQDVVGTEPPGSLLWSNSDQTLNLTHPNGVIQQVGQELYGYVRNNTGSTIPNGSAVRFAGAEQNGAARLEVAPMIADNSVPTLYIFGITTEDLEDGADGRVTVWGKVRGIDTTGPGAETWSVGDILFVSTTVAGQLTNVRPTAPNNVIPIAAVLSVNSEAGELFVRPSFEQQKNYAEFFATADQTATLSDTAYSVTFNGSGPTQQISVVSNTRVTFAETGLYQITLNAQVLSTNSSAKTVSFWYSKNGTNIANTTRLLSLASNNEYLPLSMTHSISVLAGEYMEIKWATTSTTAVLKAAPATEYYPASPSVQLIIAQPAL